MITSLELINLEDCKGLITASKDFQVRTWSMGLDLWGSLNQKTNKDDSKWNFPTKMKDDERNRDIEEMEKLMD